MHVRGLRLSVDRLERTGRQRAGPNKRTALATAERLFPTRSATWAWVRPNSLISASYAADSSQRAKVGPLQILNQRQFQ